MESVSDEPQTIESPALEPHTIELATTELPHTIDEPQMIDPPEPHTIELAATELPHMMDPPEPHTIDFPETLGSLVAFARTAKTFSIPAGSSAGLKEAINDGDWVSPAITVEENDPVAQSATAPTRLISPAPAPISPSVRRKVLVSCNAALASAGISAGRSSSNNATAPLTTPAAMLVPDNCM